MTQDSDYYFDSYSHHGIHEEMLKDEVRTSSYRNAILQNRHLFKDKVVLDVGCGTGILSMFAAKAGAKLVIGVDNSGIIEHAKQIVKDNNFSDRIVLLRGTMETVELPVQTVDIIVSEWMGYFLLYESMLDTVLFARDRYLVEGGLIFPDRTTLNLVAIEDAEYKDQKIGFWDDVYGFNYSSLKTTVLKEPLVDIVDAKHVVSSKQVILDIDLKTVTKQDLVFDTPFELKIERKDFVHAFVAWFDVYFEACHKTIMFSTGPASKYTHWKQTVFYTMEDLICEEGDLVTGKICCRPNLENNRNLDISLDWRHINEQGPSKMYVQSFRMS